MKQENIREEGGNPVEIIGSLIHQHGFMNAREALEQMGFKADFVNSPLPMWMIEKDGVQYAALNKKYAEDPELVVGDIAIGPMNEGKEELESSEKHDDDPALKGDQDELPDELQKGIIDDEDKEEEKSKTEGKLPPALQAAIDKKKGGDDDSGDSDDDDDDDDKKDEALVRLTPEQIDEIARTVAKKLIEGAKYKREDDPDKDEDEDDPDKVEESGAACGDAAVAVTLKIDGDEDGDEPGDSPGDGLEPVDEMYGDDPYEEEDELAQYYDEFPELRKKTVPGAEEAPPDVAAQIAAEFGGEEEEEEDERWKDPLQEWWDIRNAKRAERFMSWAIPKKK